MRVIYISGSGRSGSTLLERMLHSAASSSAIGEFHCLWRMDQPDINCACGSNADADPFWQEVQRRAAIGLEEMAELRRLEHVISRSTYIARHGYQLERLRAAGEVRRFLDLQFRLYEAVAEISGRAILVDSSKAGPRAWLLACDPRVSILHLYRAPADVIASWRSRKFDKGLGTDMQRLSLRQAAIDWWKVEYLARRLARETAVRMVDYQTLCQTPRSTLDGVLSAMGLPASDEAAWLQPDRVRPTLDYHSLNGNPDRFDRAPIAIHARAIDWSRYGTTETLAIRTIGTMLEALYRRPAAT